jgi:hypothetical protein
MSDPTGKPMDRLHLEIRCFVEWLHDRDFGKGEALPQVRERLAELGACEPGVDRKRLWDEVIGDLFGEWANSVAAEIQDHDMPDVVRAVLGEEDHTEPLAAKERLKERIARLRAKIESVEKEDEEFESDLVQMENSLRSYEEVLDQFGDDQRLDEVLRRGVRQAVMAKERDFQWFEALLERLRSAGDADAEDQPET